MQIDLLASLFHPALKRRGYQDPVLFTCFDGGDFQS
jgi:hypothetical protein